MRLQYVPAACPTESQPRPTDVPARVTQIAIGPPPDAPPNWLNSMAFTGKPQPAVGDRLRPACNAQSSSAIVQTGSPSSRTVKARVALRGKLPDPNSVNGPFSPLCAWTT